MIKAPKKESHPSAEALQWGRRQPIGIEKKDKTVFFHHPEFAGQYQWEKRLLEIEGVRATYPLDLLFMNLWYDFEPNGLILHSALLTNSGRAFLCAGPSGSGKSTMARLFPSHARCEELAAIIVEEESTHARTLPFWKEKRGEFPLAAIHVLEHGFRHQSTRQTPKAALALLRRQIAWPIHDPEASKKALASFCRLVTRIPIYRLAFLPQESVWPLITDVT